MHLRTQLRSTCARLRVRSHAKQAFHKYFHENGFFEVDKPIITSNDCEGGGEVFLVKPGNDKLINELKSELLDDENLVYFGKKAFLTVSGQLHLEAVCNGLGKVYTFGPTFR